MTSRTIALGLGVGYALLTLAELVFGDLAVGEVSILDRTTRSNLLHWLLALAFLGSYFSGGDVSRIACRVAGPVLLALSVWGLLSAVSLGGVLGHQEGVPGPYQVIHLLTALVALAGGFLKGIRRA